MALETDKDDNGSLAMRGRSQCVPADPAAEHSPATLAAGAVVWWGKKIALIHRPHYDDWSLPKGKVDPGESLAVTAHREILEETGLGVRLGSLLGKVTYPVRSRTKVVYYWNAEVLGGEFKKNSEVDELRWVTLDEARELLSYKLDRKVLDKAAKRQPSTTRIIYVRHARAHNRRNWAGDDNKRPLDRKGRRQAEALAQMIAGFYPTKVYSAKPDRCVATAEPIARELGVKVKVDREFGDAAENPRARFDELLTPGVKVVVSQGDTMPMIIAQLAAESGLDVGEPTVKKAGVWVLGFTKGKLKSADYLVSPLPLK